MYIAFAALEQPQTIRAIGLHQTIGDCNATSQVHTPLGQVSLSLHLSVRCLSVCLSACLSVRVFYSKHIILCTSIVRDYYSAVIATGWLSVTPSVRHTPVLVQMNQDMIVRSSASCSTVILVSGVVMFIWYSQVFTPVRWLKWLLEYMTELVHDYCTNSFQLNWLSL